MKLQLVVLTAVCALAALAGCRSHNPNVKEFTVADSEAAHASKAIFFDANNDDFRKSNGKVPGAVLLAGYKNYDVAATLPADKAQAIVFYCSNKL